MGTQSPTPAPQPRENLPSGEFVDLDGERFYAIRQVDRMPPFLVSVVSSGEHWMYVSSAGGLTAGRTSPDTALFPYVTVDKLHDAGPHTGPKTLLRLPDGEAGRTWEPFNREHDHRYRVTRNLYKSVLGDKLCFEEINQDLELGFRYTWRTSDEHGFVRTCELRNLGGAARVVELIDGLQNLLPAGTPRFAQTNTSNLVDAYKWSEADPRTGLALFTLYSGITDRAEPCESLKATVAYCLGLDAPTLLLSTSQLDAFRRRGNPRAEDRRRGLRAAFFACHRLELAGGAARRWSLVADVEQGQAQVVALRRTLADRATLQRAVDAAIARGSDELERIMAGSDGLQATDEEPVSVHHYANVLFNVLRGGHFPRQYRLPVSDFAATVQAFNRPVHERWASLFASLPDFLESGELWAAVRDTGDPQLARLCLEYLPIAFGRRHGDPSRPWNQFEIRLKDRQGLPLYWYAGNWRDIFQNWEALAWSFPEFVESMIAKFVNASTMDGHNPYRITKGGIDWEVEDPEDPWSHIGYWGDHQLIYLLKFLEISRSFHPARLATLLNERLFAYANVPYRIRPFPALLEDAKNTVVYDAALAQRIEETVARTGADGKLVLDAEGNVHLVTLLEKLLVPLLAKLGNLVPDGGLWMNTQRPEWNDANNALVGHGLSMVTLYYLRRYVHFLQSLLAAAEPPIELSAEVATWLEETASALSDCAVRLDGGRSLSPAQRLEVLTALGEAASRYRETVYRQGRPAGRRSLPAALLRDFLRDVVTVTDRSIARNRRDDGLYHAYNLLRRGPGGVDADALYPMLEGQVAALSSGAIMPSEAVGLLEALFDSDLYRADQSSFLLYPDRALPGFLEKNLIPPEAIAKIPLLQRLAAEGHGAIVLKDADGCWRFSAEFRNAGDLEAELARLEAPYSGLVEGSRPALRSLFEEVFNHRAFTGRSGTMFGFEGLGCIYWHMVSKLLLAVQEVFFAAVDGEVDPVVTRRLGELYYRVRGGLGFNKTPAEYGAFPTDPYSHTPGHAGARQPGMTGQVKEEILARFGELGVRVSGGRARFAPALLRRQEFLRERRAYRFLDVRGEWRHLEVPAGGLAFSWCQVPVVYRLDPDAPAPLAVTVDGAGTHGGNGAMLSAEDSASLFRRDGRVRGLLVTLRPNQLFGG